MVVNAIKCNKCNNTIYSRATHDFHWCPCGSCAVDGGFDYFKITGNPNDFETTKLNVLDNEDINVAKKKLYDDWNFGNNQYGTVYQGDV